MIAAIYARKSTDDSDRNEEARSITRQVERATEYAVAKGWTVDPRHVCVDDAVSGAEWKHRPGFNALLAALEPRPPFGMLVVSELSRIGRDTVRTPYAVQQLEEAGVEIHGYLSGQRISVEDELGEMQTMLHSLAGSFERRRARQRTYDALRRRAEAGAVTGGKVYGYRNERDAGGYVRRRIEPLQADIVRRIFREYASGRGFKLIASALNRDGVRGPRGTVGGWRVSGVREMLHRELYHGVIVWGQTRKITRRGTKGQENRPESEWQRIEAPPLRIIEEPLWQQVQGRLKARQQMLTRGTRGRLLSRPSYLDGLSPYLLTGFVRCRPCGGAIGSIPRAHGSVGHRRRVDFSGCFANHRGGHAACTNNLHERQEVLDRAILDAIVEKLDDGILSEAIELALPRLLAQRTGLGERREALEHERATLERRSQRGLDAYLDGDGLRDELRARVQADKTQKLTVEAELAALAAPSPALDPERLRATLRGHGADVRALLGRHVSQARQMLRKLLDGTTRILEPMVVNGERRYAFSGSGNYLRLLPADLARTVVAPTGFEPVFQP